MGVLGDAGEYAGGNGGNLGDRGIWGGWGYLREEKYNAWSWKQRSVYLIKDNK